MRDLASTLRSLANGVPEKEFLERASGLYLMITMSGSVEGEISFNTRSVSVARLTKAGQAARSRVIVALQKTETSPYSSQISVGRTRNCDIMLREASVSKLHAHFFKRDGKWHVIDRASANGTSVNGRLILPKQPQPIAPGDRIEFGAVECLLADGEILYRDLGPGR